MIENESEYDALLIDTSIFDGHGLRLEKGLLGKLYQFQRSPVDLLMPDVICSEIKAHLEHKVKSAKASLEKSINDAGDHLILDEASLNESRVSLIDNNETSVIVNGRFDNFINTTGALIIECGEYVTIKELLDLYFKNKPPFSETGKKKNEFPDAIILMAMEQWAERENKLILAVAKDDDWLRYCETSKRISYIDDLSTGFAIFNKTNAPYAFLTKLETSLDNNLATSFLRKIEDKLTYALDGFTPDQDADSYLYWESEGSNAWFKEFNFVRNEFQIIDIDDDFIVLGADAIITIEAEGEFSLSAYDSIDGDYVSLSSVTANVEKEFKSEILITIMGDFNGSLDDLSIDEVEIVSPPRSIHFGTLVPDFGDYD